MHGRDVWNGESYGAEIAKAIKPDAAESEIATVVEMLNGFAEIVRGAHRNDIVKLIANYARPYELLRESWKMKIAVSEHGTLINDEFREEIHAGVEKCQAMLNEVSARADAVVTAP